jgi:acyl-CoA thioesterase-1
LKHKTNLLQPKLGTPVFCETEDVLAIEVHATLSGLVEPGQQTQKRGLPASGRSDDGQKRLGFDFQIERGQYAKGPPAAHVGFFEALGHDHHIRRFLFISTLACAACLQPDAPDSATFDSPDVVATAAPGAAEASGATAAGVAHDAPSDLGRPAVVFLGTSLTAGLGLSSDEDSYVARVAELADSAGLPIRAVNAGVSGETSAGGLRRLGWVLREPIDVLVLELGANDGLRGLDPADLENNLRTIIDRTLVRYPDSRVVIAGMEAPTNLGSAYTDRFRQTFVSVAQQTGATLIPFLLEGVAGVPELNQDDHIHPTAEGHERLARNVWQVLEGVLRSRDEAQ